MRIYLQMLSEINDLDVSPCDFGPKAGFLHVLSLPFPSMINVLRLFLELEQCQRALLKSRAILPVWSTTLPFFITVLVALFPVSESFIRRRNMCSSCHTATGTDFCIVMQADTEAPHLNAKNRPCVFVCLGRIQTWQSRLQSKALQDPHHSNACRMPQF